jgi:hypothetical protein
MSIDGNVNDTAKFISMRSKLAVKRPISSESNPIAKKPHHQSLLMPLKNNKRKIDSNQKPITESFSPQRSCRETNPVGENLHMTNHNGHSIGSDKEITIIERDDRIVAKSGFIATVHCGGLDASGRRKCIICMKDLSHASEQVYSEHVNRCLDTTAQTTKATHNEKEAAPSSSSRSLPSVSKAKKLEERRNDLINKLIEEKAPSVINPVVPKATSSAAVKMPFLSAAGAISKDELDLQRLRTELADIVAKQSELKTREKKIKSDIKKIMRKSLSTLTPSSVPIPPAVPEESVDQSTDYQPDKLLAVEIYPKASVAQLKGDPSRPLWKMSNIEVPSFDESSANAKLKAVNFHILNLSGDDLEPSTDPPSTTSASMTEISVAIPPIDSMGVDRDFDATTAGSVDTVMETNSDCTEVDNHQVDTGEDIPLTQVDFVADSSTDKAVYGELVWTQIFPYVSDDMLSMLPSTQIY